MLSDLIDRPVVIRSSKSGVWFGVLVAGDGERVRLRDARRAWNWTGATDCAGLAVRGPSGGKITEAVETAVVSDVAEVLAATPAAVERWRGVSPWVVS